MLDAHRLSLGSSALFGGLQVMFSTMQAQGPCSVSPMQSEVLIVLPLPHGDYKHECRHEEGLPQSVSRGQHSVMHMCVRLRVGMCLCVHVHDTPHAMSVLRKRTICSCMISSTSYRLCSHPPTPTSPPHSCSHSSHSLCSHPHPAPYLPPPDPLSNMDT